MSSDDSRLQYQVQNICRYSRKTYKKNRRSQDDAFDNPNIEPDDTLGRINRIDIDNVGCSCEIEPESEIANILHKKCPVITLAQQQIQRLLEETDRLICDNTKCYRSLYGFLSLCTEFLQSQDFKCRCIILFLILVSFVYGMLLGAGTCGSYLGQFNSPIFSCIDSYFVIDKFKSIEDSYRSIV